MLIAVVNAKGGVGKSTLALHAAVWLARRGLRVAAVDGDERARLAQWLARGKARIEVARLPTTEGLLRELPGLIGSVDAVVADAPAALGAQAAALLKLADVALLPVCPSMLDTWASERTARLIHAVRYERKAEGLPKVFAVLNRLPPRSRASRLAADVALQYGFPVANTAVHLREALANASGRGRTVFETGAAGREAGEELDALFREVLFIPATQPRSAAAAAVAASPRRRPSRARFANGASRG